MADRNLSASIQFLNDWKAKMNELCQAIQADRPHQVQQLQPKVFVDWCTSLDHEIRMMLIGPTGNGPAARPLPTSTDALSEEDLGWRLRAETVRQDLWRLVTEKKRDDLQTLRPICEEVIQIRGQVTKALMSPKWITVIIQGCKCEECKKA